MRTLPSSGEDVALEESAADHPAGIRLQESPCGTSQAPFKGPGEAKSIGEGDCEGRATQLRGQVVTASRSGRRLPSVTVATEVRRPRLVHRDALDRVRDIGPGVSRQWPLAQSRAWRRE